METSKGRENTSSLRHQQQNRDRYPFVTSVREQNSWQNLGRKTSPAVHLLSCMAEFIEDENKQPEQRVLDLNQFEKLKQHNHTHHFDFDFSKNNSSHSRHAAKQSPQNTILESSKQMKCRVAKQMDSFNRTASSSKHSTRQQDPSKSFQRDKTPIVQEIKNRIKESLANYISSNDRKNIEAKMLQLNEEHEKKVEEMLKEVTKLREQNKQQTEQHESELLKKEIERAKMGTDYDELKLEYERTVRELERTKAATNDLKEFRKEYKELVEAYPDLTCSKLLKEYKRLEHVCLTRLGDLDKELVDRFEDEKRPLEAKVDKLTRENKELKDQLAQMTRMVDGRHLIETLDYREIENLKKCKQELTQLQNKILEIYVKWEQYKTDSQKEVLSHYGCLAKQYSYLQMLQYMEFDKRQLCTDEKTREFLRRTLGLIQATRKKLFNQPVPDKKNPEKILEQIVKLVVRLRHQLKHNEPKSGKLQG